MRKRIVSWQCQEVAECWLYRFSKPMPLARLNRDVSMRFNTRYYYTSTGV